MNEEEELEELLSEAEPANVTLHFTLIVDFNYLIPAASINEIKRGFGEVFSILDESAERVYWILEPYQIRSVNVVRGFTGRGDSLKERLLRWQENVLPGWKTASSSYLDYTNFKKIAEQGNELSRTLLVTPGYYMNDRKAAANMKCFAENGKLTILYIGEKDPTPRRNSAILQMSEFAEVKCLPGYSRRHGDIETFMVEYARNIIEEEKKWVDSRRGQ